MDVAESQTLPQNSEAPRLARRYLASWANGWSAELLDQVVLMASELVTNAVVHGRGPVELRLHDDGAVIRVEVGDGRPDALPCLAARPPGSGESGRGLFIVDRCADRWGHERRADPPGKIVWFELRRRPEG